MNCLEQKEEEEGRGAADDKIARAVVGRREERGRRNARAHANIAISPKPEHK